MRLKPIYALLAFVCLFTATTNVNLEARHSRHTTVEVTNYTYATPNYYYQPQYVVQPQPVYVAQPVYAQPVYVAQPVQPVVYQERVYVRERTSPGALITSFALGLGFGLLR